MYPEIDELLKNISLITKTEVLIEPIGDTYILESELFVFSFVLDTDHFEVRNIEVFQAGFGRRLITAVHDFCDENDLAVFASHVKETAIGFWEKLGYQEGHIQGEYFRVT